MIILCLAACGLIVLFALCCMLLAAGVRVLSLAIQAFNGNSAREEPPKTPPLDPAAGKSGHRSIA